MNQLSDEDEAAETEQMDRPMTFTELQKSAVEVIGTQGDGFTRMSRSAVARVARAHSSAQFFGEIVKFPGFFTDTIEAVKDGQLSMNSRMHYMTDKCRAGNGDASEEHRLYEPL